MTTTPRLAVTELAASQAIPETTVNEMIRRLEQGANHFTVKDRDLATPPGSPADGDRYIVATSGTGAWSGHDGDIAYYQSSAWLFIDKLEGMAFWIEDENVLLIWNGATFDSFGGGASVNSQSGTTYTSVIGDANNYIRFTSASAVTFTIPANASVAYPVGTSIELEQAGAGTVTIDPDSGVTINSRGGLLDTAGQYAIAGLKKVATNTWTLTGDIA